MNTVVRFLESVPEWFTALFSTLVGIVVGHVLSMRMQSKTLETHTENDVAGRDKEAVERVVLLDFEVFPDKKHREKAYCLVVLPARRNRHHDDRSLQHTVGSERLGCRHPGLDRGSDGFLGASLFKSA